MGAVALWSVALIGFAVYVLKLGSFRETYGGLGVGVLLILWVTLFSLLFHATPRIRSPRRIAPTPAPAEAQMRPPETLSTSIGARIDLVVVPSAALRNSTAQGHMMSALGPRARGLEDHEIDIMDWGFAYGVAWAVARSQDPVAHEETISERALHATQAVYEAYRGSASPPVSSPAPHTDAHRS